MARIRDEELAARTAAGAAPGPGLEEEARQTTRSWQIIRRMPKGALLRANHDTMVDIDHLLEVALRTPGLHISCPDGNLATAEARRKGRLRIRFRATEGTEDSLWTSDYRPGTSILLTKAADRYPEGGRRGFVKWLKGRCMITEQEPDLPGLGKAPPPCSDVIHGMIHYEPIWRASLRRLMSCMVEDGIYWLELR